MPSAVDDVTKRHPPHAGNRAIQRAVAARRLCVIAMVLLVVPALVSAAPPAGGAVGPGMTGKGPAGAKPVGAKPQAAKKIAWLTNFNTAQIQAVKSDKIMLLYFSGSDWDDWTVKLEKEVMTTPMVADWIAANVIPVNIDFPKDEKKAAVRKANEKFKVQFNIAKVPTFLFVDPGGDILARVGYDTARLRDEETPGEPKGWVAFCDETIKNRPPRDVIKSQPNLAEAVKAVRASSLPLLMLITQNPTEAVLRDKDALLQNLAFARFVNRNMAFLEIKWPADTDKSPDAEAIRAFAAKWKFGPAPIELVVWDPGGLGTLKAQITSGVTSIQAPSLIKRLDATLPRIDYGGEWIEDYKKARAIAHQQPERDIILSFVREDGTDDHSNRVIQEIYQTREWKDFTSKSFILLKLNYPTKPDPKTGKMQDEKLKEQNRMLADMYGVRGYPTIIILNNVGQKIGTARYDKGGPTTFIPEINKLRKADRERRILPSMLEAAKPE